MTDTVIVFPGDTLIIEPGVVVKFANNQLLEMDPSSVIIAQGTTIDSITFTSNSVTPNQGSWIGISVDGSANTISKFNCCNIKYSEYGVWGGPLRISNSNLNNNKYGMYLCSYVVNIDSCNFRNNEYGIEDGTFNINYCKFLNNKIALDDIVLSLITNCTISSNQTGLHQSSENRIKNCIIDSNSVWGINVGILDSIVNCQIRYNAIGVMANEGTIVMNDIEYNTIGILDQK